MDNISEIKKNIAEPWSHFEQLLSSTLESRSVLLNRINAYLFDTSGKQIRPLLAFVSAMAGSGVINEKTVACATASELIHTASLLHDDVVDNSEQRRGNKTVCKLFSPGASILIGDFWLTRALSLLLERQCPNEVLRCYAGTLEELAEGEMMQMDFADSLTTTEEDYFKVMELDYDSYFIKDDSKYIIFDGYFFYTTVKYSSGKSETSGLKATQIVNTYELLKKYIGTF